MGGHAKHPFEVTSDELRRDLEPYIDEVFRCLESEFMVMPKGQGFIDFAEFERGYENLKRETLGFQEFTPERALGAVEKDPVSLLVIRTILGFTPSEWSYVSTRRSGVPVGESFARGLERRIRLNSGGPIRLGDLSRKRLVALIDTACYFVKTSPPDVGEECLHRLGKADTCAGVDGVRAAAQLGLPYAMVLYERFLGRPFAGHRDAVSELVGDALETAIEELLVRAGVSYRKTKRAERIVGFDQAPDFLIPCEFNPKVVIEAKISEDSGTARDKVTRVQHLAEIAAQRAVSGSPRFQVVACIGGRGFGVRRQDMRKLLFATEGKVFTPKTLVRLLDCTETRQFVTR